MKSTVSILGLYNYDSTIFERFFLPTDVLKQTLIQRILLECAELEVLYPNPEIMREAIGLWSTSRVDAWGKMVRALNASYDPTHNYIMEEDRFERGTSESNVEGKSKDDTYKQAFNGDSMMNTTENESSNKVESDGENTREVARTVKGNALGGSFQNNVEKELKLRKTTIYEIIINEFKKEFCILVY